MNPRLPAALIAAAIVVVCAPASKTPDWFLAPIVNVNAAPRAGALMCRPGCSAGAMADIFKFDRCVVESTHDGEIVIALFSKDGNRVVMAQGSIASIKKLRGEIRKTLRFRKKYEGDEFA